MHRVGRSATRRAMATTITVAAVFVASSGCGGDDEGDSNGSNCDQACIDGTVVFATWLSVDGTLYNKQVVGHGLPRTAVPCPGGGSVDISGSAFNVGGTNMLDLTYDLAACRFSEPGWDLAYTGTLKESGSFNNETKVTNLTYVSASLDWTGTIGYSSNRYPASGKSCAVRLSKTDIVKGSLCGRPERQGSQPPVL